MAIEKFEDIEGWQLARKLTLQVYEATKQLDFSKDFGFKDQITRASGSIMNNASSREV